MCRLPRGVSCADSRGASVGWRAEGLPRGGDLILNVLFRGPRDPAVLQLPALLSRDVGSGRRIEARGPKVESGFGLDPPKQREALHGSAQMSPWVAVLQAADEQRVQGRRRNHAELAGHGHAACQTPVGDADAHPSWMLVGQTTSSDDVVTCVMEIGVPPGPRWAPRRRPDRRGGTSARRPRSVGSARWCGRTRRRPRPGTGPPGGPPVRGSGRPTR